MAGLLRLIVWINIMVQDINNPTTKLLWTTFATADLEGIAITVPGVHMYAIHGLVLTTVDRHRVNFAVLDIYGSRRWLRCGLPSSLRSATRQGLATSAHVQIWVFEIPHFILQMEPEITESRNEIGGLRS